MRRFSATASVKAVGGARLNDMSTESEPPQAS